MRRVLPNLMDRKTVQAGRVCEHCGHELRDLTGHTLAAKEFRSPGMEKMAREGKKGFTVKLKRGL